MKKLVLPILSALGLLTGCTHKSVVAFENQCFQWVAKGELTPLRENFEACRKTNSRHATSMLMMAASRDQIEIMDFLISKGEPVNDTDLNGDTPLFYAASASKTKAIAWLLDHGAATKSFRKDGISPFMLSLQNGTKDSFAFYLQNENQIKELNNPTEDGWTPIFFAVRKEDPALLKNLIDLGADTQYLSKENETPLVLADEQQWQEGIKILKAKKSKPTK